MAILETAYRSEARDDAWVRGLVERVQPHADAGFGVLGFLYDASDPDGVRAWSPAASGVAPHFADLGLRLATSLSGDAARRLFEGPPAVNALSAIPEVEAELCALPGFEAFAAMGCADLLGVRAPCDEARGAYLVVPRASRGAVTPEAAFVWTRVAVHVAAALRLRARHLSTLPPPLPSDEDETTGIFEKGRVPFHRQERGPAPAEPRPVSDEEAVALWEGLVAGAWSVLDHFEHDGRRFVIARRGERAPPAHPELTPREAAVTRLAALGHSNKLIAYEMGLSISTVALHLSRASKKLGATSRVALIRSYKKLSPPQYASEPSPAAPRSAAKERQRSVASRAKHGER